MQQQSSDDQIGTSLMSRQQVYNQMLENQTLPASTVNSIIVPCVGTTMGFKNNIYSQNLSVLQEHLSRAEFNGVVRSSNKVIEENVIFKNNKENESFFGTISTLLKISLLIAFVGFVFLGVTLLQFWNEDISSYLLTCAAVLLSISGAVAGVCPIILYKSEFETINYEDKIRRQLQEVISAVNLELKKKKDNCLEWKMQEDYFWIQLLIKNDIRDERSDGIQESEDEEESQNQELQNSANDFFHK